MDKAKVCLVRCENYDGNRTAEAVAKQFEFLGGVDKFVKRGDRVLLKPNMIAPRSYRHAAQTHPSIIIAAARLLKDFGAKPVVGDSPAWTNVSTCAEALKLTEPLKQLGVPLIDLNRPKWRRVDQRGTKVGISSEALEADVIINLPKFKSHQQLVATFAVKNMFGCVCGKQKTFWHYAKGKTQEQFCEFLIGVYRYIAPAITIIDGVVAMDGAGPINGRSRPLGWLIGATDPIACEVICAGLIDLQAEEIPMIKTAKKLNYGCSNLENIEIKGDAFEFGFCKDFEPANLIPVRFSFFQICKSIVRQIILLAKAAVKK